MSPRPATRDQVLALRVGAHHLDRPATVGLVPLVRRLAGVHAQLASSAESALWLRAGIEPAEVRQALATDRTLVRTWAVRGTLHLLPAADLPTWTAALGTRSFPRPTSWYAYHQVTPADMAAIEAVVPRCSPGRRSPASSWRPRSGSRPGGTRRTSCCPAGC